MDAPKCKICGNRHYGLCHGVVAPVGEEPAAVKAARGVEQPDVTVSVDVVEEPGSAGGPLPLGSTYRLDLEERVVALEQIVDELLAGKRKRSAYMKAYMRDRRAKDGAG